MRSFHTLFALSAFALSTLVAGTTAHAHPPKSFAKKSIRIKTELKTIKSSLGHEAKVPVKAKIRITHDHIDGGQKADSADTDFARSLGCKDDHAGHILAKRLGGKKGYENMVPLGNYANQQMKKPEAQAYEWAKYYGFAQLIITFEYGDSKTPWRPTKVHYKVKSRNCMNKVVREQWSITNSKPSSCRRVSPGKGAIKTGRARKK